MLALGPFGASDSLPLQDFIFILNDTTFKKPVQGTVYTYRLALHLRKTLTKQLAAFPPLRCQSEKRLPPSGLQPRTSTASHSVQ